jgi:hypothetical protein
MAGPARGLKAGILAMAAGGWPLGRLGVLATRRRHTQGVVLPRRPSAMRVNVEIMRTFRFRFWGIVSSRGTATMNARERTTDHYRLSAAGK